MEVHFFSQLIKDDTMRKLEKKLNLPEGSDPSQIVHALLLTIQTHPLYLVGKKRKEKKGKGRKRKKKNTKENFTFNCTPLQNINVTPDGSSKTTQELLAEQKQKLDKRKQYHKSLYARNKIIDAYFKDMIEKAIPSQSSKEDLIAQLQFYFNHPSSQSSPPALTLEDLEKLVKGVTKGNFLHDFAQREMKEILALTPQEMLQLKDECHLSEEGIKFVMEKFSGLTCTMPELKALIEVERKTFHAALQPLETPDGYTINLTRLCELLRLAYPAIKEDPLVLGVNMDATEMGGEKTTAASLRLLNNILRQQGVLSNSSKNQWAFSLHYGGDGKEFLAENVFRNGEEGEKEQFLATFSFSFFLSFFLFSFFLPCHLL